MKQLNILKSTLAIAAFGLSTPLLAQFNLSSPANNTSLTVEGNASTTIDITWTPETSLQGTILYTWHLDLPSGNFTSPIVSIPSNNSGAATTLTLSLGAINGVLDGAGVPLGQMASLKWTVTATNGMMTTFSPDVFNINLTRGVTLSAFDLLGPADNFSATVEGDGAAELDVTWNSAGQGATYAWFLDVQGGSFNPGVVNKLFSNNMGMDTVLTLDFAIVDAVLAGAGITDGQTANLIWKIHAYGGSDSLPSAQTFNIALTKGKVLQAFNLTFPTNAFGATIEGAGTNTLNVTWEPSHPDAAYSWYLDVATGDFSNAVVSGLASNNMGMDTVLTLDWTTIESVLVGAGVAEGATANLKWKVVANVGTGLDKDSESEFTIDLTNGAVIETFDLTFPIDGFAATIDNDATSSIDITWDNAGAGATYKWFLDLASGDFSNPILNGLDANNMGMDTTITLDFATIHSVLVGAGVTPGATANLKWKVHAYAGTDSIASTSEYLIDLTRGVTTGLSTVKAATFNMYPNPVAQGQNLNIDGISSASYTIIDVIGQTVKAGSTNESINTSSLNQGMYFIHVEGSKENKQFIVK